MTEDKKLSRKIKDYNEMIWEQKSWGCNKVAKLLEDDLVEELK